MASVNWMKLKGGSMTSAIIAHITRHDWKEGVKYSNPDVDESRADCNYVIYGLPQTSGLIRSRLDKRVKELDAIKPPKRVKADRVTAVAFELTVPRGLPEKHHKAFFRMAWEEIAKTCGGRQNVSVGVVHGDEKHLYRDAMTGKQVMSLDHMHMVGVPWTEEHGVNCKHFVTRWRMSELNKRIDERCREMFHMPFITGECERSGRDVIDLKRESMRQDVSELEKSFFEANLQLYEAKCTLDEERAKIGDLERYKAMEKWMREHCYLKGKGLVTEHTVSLLSDFEKDFKKSKHIDREEPSRQIL